MGVRPISRLIVIYIRFVSRIATALLLLVPCSAHARDLEDKIVFVSRIHGTAKSDLFLVEGLDGRRIQLTQNLYASCPSIPPDGNQVVFVSEPAVGTIQHSQTKPRESPTPNRKLVRKYLAAYWFQRS